MTTQERIANVRKNLSIERNKEIKAELSLVGQLEEYLSELEAQEAQSEFFMKQAVATRKRAGKAAKNGCNLMAIKLIEKADRYVAAAKEAKHVS